MVDTGGGLLFSKGVQRGSDVPRKCQRCWPAVLDPAARRVPERSHPPGPDAGTAPFKSGSDVRLFVATMFEPIDKFELEDAGFSFSFPIENTVAGQTPQVNLRVGARVQKQSVKKNPPSNIRNDQVRSKNRCHFSKILSTTTP